MVICFCYFQSWIFLTFTLTILCSAQLGFFVVSWLLVFSVCFKIFPELFYMVSVASLIIFLNTTCTVFLLYFYFRTISASFLITFLSPEIATSTCINRRVSSSLFQIMVSGLLLRMVLSLCSFGFHNMITLHARRVSTNFGTCSYHCSFSSFA